MAEGPLTCARDGLCVASRLTPLAEADRLLAAAAAAEDRQVVEACVTAPAANGHGNEALMPRLARAWRLYRCDLAILALAGATSRHKTVRVAGGPGPLRDRLGALIAALPGR